MAWRMCVIGERTWLGNTMAFITGKKQLFIQQVVRHAYRDILFFYSQGLMKGERQAVD